MMQLKDLCFALVKCESEDEVIEILKKEAVQGKNNLFVFLS